MWPFSRRQPSRPEQRSITEWPWGDSGPSTIARPVSVDRALSLVPVFGAARLLADSIASLTPALYRQGPNGVMTRLAMPSLFVNPSVHGTVFDWLHRAVVSMALYGDAVGLVTMRDYYGFPTMIEWLNPAQVTVQDAMAVGPGSYMSPTWWWWQRQVATEDVVHIPWFCLPYRVRGLSPIGAFALTANVGLGAQEYAAAWFNNGGVPPGILRNTMQRVEKAEADEITSRVTSRLQSRKPLVVGNDWLYEPIAIKPHEAQFVETSQLTATQIATIYGVPPEKIGGTTGNSLTYATVEQNSIDFVTFSLRPWLVRLETALSNLFPRGTVVKFDTTELLRTDAKTRAEIDAITLGGTKPAFRTVDEVRADRDLPPMPKPEPPAAEPPSPSTEPPSASTPAPSAAPPNGAKSALNGSPAGATP